MKNKAYEHPYGSTVVPSNGGSLVGDLGVRLPPGSVPGVPSGIPGTIGVAGPKLREIPPLHGIVEDLTKPRDQSVANLVDDFVSKLVELIADRVAERVLERFVPVSVGEFVPVGATEETTEEALQAFATPGMSPLHVVPEEVTLASVRAYSKAHHELEAKLSEWQPWVKMQRFAPSPPCWRVTDVDGVVSEWAAYSSHFNTPRFPVTGLNDGEYLVIVDGKQQTRLWPNDRPLLDRPYSVGLSLDELLVMVLLRREKGAPKPLTNEEMDAQAAKYFQEHPDDDEV